MTRAVFLLALTYRLRRARRLALAGRYSEGRRLADRLAIEIEQFRERHGCPAGIVGQEARG